MSAYLLTGKDAFHTEKIPQFFSQVIAKQKNSILHDYMIEILKTLADAGSANFELSTVQKIHGIASGVSLATAATYLTGGTCRV